MNLQRIGKMPRTTPIMEFEVENLRSRGSCTPQFEFLTQVCVRTSVDLLTTTSLTCLLPAATKLGQGNVFTGVCDSVHGGVCISACWDTTPQEQTPPWEQTRPPRSRHPPPGPDPPRPGTTPPSGPDPPRSGHPPPASRRQHTVNERPVRILLECILVFICKLPRLVDVSKSTLVLTRTLVRNSSSN